MNSIYRKKVLIIQNDALQLNAISRSLAPYPFEIITAVTGLAGYERIREIGPHIVLAADHLPDIDGIELCWMIRQNSQLSNIPYILLVDKINSEEKINAYRSGVDIVLENIHSGREIYTRIEALIKRIQQISDSQAIPEHSLKGKLTHFSVVEMIQLLNILKKSGILTIVNQTKQGQLGFMDGKLVWAEADHSQGEKAVKDISTWQKGYFYFEKDLIKPIINIEISTMQLILECCKSLDEQSITS